MEKNFLHDLLDSLKPGSKLNSVDNQTYEVCGLVQQYTPGEYFITLTNGVITKEHSLKKLIKDGFFKLEDFIKKNIKKTESLIISYKTRIKQDQNIITKKDEEEFNKVFRTK